MSVGYDVCVCCIYDSLCLCCVECTIESAVGFSVLCWFVFCCLMCMCGVCVLLCSVVCVVCLVCVCCLCVCFARFVLRC